MGVGHQYCGAVGKQANCQVTVEILVSDGEIAAPALGAEVYGASIELRQTLRELGLEYFLNAGGGLLAWTQAPKLCLAKKHCGQAEGEPAASSLDARLHLPGE